MDVAGALVDSDNGRLGQDDPAAADIDERVRGAGVDGHVAAPEPADGREDPHEACADASYLPSAEPRGRAWGRIPGSDPWTCAYRPCLVRPRYAPVSIRSREARCGHRCTQRPVLSWTCRAHFVSRPQAASFTSPAGATAGRRSSAIAATTGTSSRR